MHNADTEVEPNLRRYAPPEAVPISSLAPGDLFCLPWDPELRGPVGQVVRIRSGEYVVTNLGKFGLDFCVIQVMQ
jgi:cell wall assembly regulator SMI1